MVIKLFIPKNEMGVQYLFAKYHEQMGFESIVSFQQFPDVTAKRKGKIVRIELEFKLSQFAEHFGDRERSTPYTSFSRGNRKFNNDVDIIVCWKKDIKLDYPVEVIELSRLSDKVE